MDQRLVIGESVNLITPEEMQTALNNAVDKAFKIFASPQTERRSKVFTVGSDGTLGTNNSARLMTVPQGFKARVHRLGLYSPAYTPTNPLAAGYIYACVDSVANGPEYMFPGDGTTVLPSLWTNGFDEAVRLNGGQSLYLFGSGLPAGMELLVNIQWNQTEMGKSQ
jgi:hypothetical protein